MVSVAILMFLWGVDMKLKNKYRIVRDKYSGYEAQVKYWFFPFIWLQVGFSNTSRSVEGARLIIEHHKIPVVEYVD